MRLSLLLKNGKKFLISLVMQKLDTNQVNKLDLKHHCYYQNYAITVINILFLEELLMLQTQIIMHMIKDLLLQIMHLH